MKMKNIVCLVIIAVLAVGCIGCSKDASKMDGKNLTLWAETSTVKILQDDKGEAVKSAKDKGVLEVHMAKNESEGVQLMMYAKKDISDYSVEVSDLVCGDSVISTEAIDVYTLKYQTVEILQSTPNEAFPVGSRVPDPLLPMNTAIEYKENTIDKGNNQAVYFDVATTVETIPGVYEGTVTVEANGEQYKAPMKVTVYDVELPATPALKTAFTYFMRDNFANAELDASDAMTEKYFETLLEYNMGSYLPFEGDGGIERYLELLKKYYNYPGFTAYRLYYDTNGSAYEGKECRYNAPLLKEYIRAIAEMSVQEQVDYLEKAYCYFYTVADEPTSEADFMTAKYALDIYKDILADCDAELRYKYFGTAEYEYYVSEISESLLGLPNILPGSLFTEELEIYGLEELTLVPEIDYLHSDASRKQAKEGREDKQLWTYTCNFPVYPYPTSHVDDYNLGMRLTSWMCFDYDWDGFLQWRSVGYNYGTTGGSAVPDAWEIMNSEAGRPGEGIYFYPGAKYGLEGPCPSIRAMIYRDGTEDYELLRVVQNLYEQNGLEATYAMDTLFDQVYSGTIPTTDSYLFEEVRKEVFSLVDDLRSNVGVLYENVAVGFDSVELTFRTTDAKAKVKVDGKDVKASENGSYQLTFDITKQDTCEIYVSCGDNEKTYTRRLCDGLLGTACAFEEEGNVKDYILTSKEGSEVAFNQNSSYALDSEKSLHLLLNQGKEDAIPYFAIDKDSKLIGGNWEKISGMKFYVYNNSSEDISMDATYYTSTEVLVNTYQLKAGEWTMVEIKMPTDLKDINTIQEFDFNFEKGSAADLYIDNFVTIVGEE